jgi:lipid-binding SYLF domain-containing protein
MIVTGGESTSMKKFGIITFSCFLTFALALITPAQQSKDSQQPQQNPSSTQKSPSSTTKERSGAAGATEKQTASKQEIRQAQQALKDKGMYSGSVNGQMSPEWEQALRDFQSKNNLKATGKLDHETKSALGLTTEKPAGAAGKATTGKEKPATTEPGQTKRAPGKSSKYESSQDIRQVQMALQQKGSYSGPIDGVMGPKTKMALAKFQREQGLFASGGVDPTTLIALGVRPGAETGGQLYAGREKSRLQSQTTPNTSSSGQTSSTRTTKSKSEATRHKGSQSTEGKSHMDRVTKATTVLQEVTTTGDHRIPDGLLNRAEAIAVIPGVVKGAFGIGGRWGKGLLSERLPDGRWSQPAFIQMGGGSFGAQLGVSSTDLVLVFTDKAGLRNLEQGKEFKLGVDAGVVAGPVGREAEAGANLKSGIYGYSRSKGLFAGIALDGAVISLDDSANRDVYGTMTTSQIWTATTPNPSVQPFVDTLNRISPTKKVTEL